MNIAIAFDRTLSQFGISAKWLGAESGVSEVMISRFRNGKQVQTDTLDKLLDALPEEPKQYFFSLVLGSVKKSNTRQVDIKNLIETADYEDIEEIMLLLAKRWRRVSVSENTQVVA